MAFYPVEALIDPVDLSVELFHPAHHVGDVTLVAPRQHKGIAAFDVIRS
ncbi:MAG: hypothetical protein AB3N13_17320 [Arenibacterium sp.]